jgi:TonB family protein
MKKIFLLTFLIASAISLFAQQQDANKFQKSDESGYIEVDKAPETIKPPAPVYPPEAKMQAIEGKVFLKILIDEKGNVIKEKIERSVNQLLDNSALEAVKSAKFSPALVKNKPVKVWVTIPISFKMNLNENEDEPDMNSFVKVEEMPQMITHINPEYPDELKKKNIEGKVYVKLLIDKEGNPKKAVVIKSDNEALNKLSIDAAMKSKFTTAKIKKEPLAIWVVVPYRFSLSEAADDHLKKFNSVDEARKAYEELVYRYIKSDEAKTIFGDYKLEKVESEIKYGDESVLYKAITEKHVGYIFLALNGMTTIRYISQSLGEIRNYVYGSLLKESGVSQSFGSSQEAEKNFNEATSYVENVSFAKTNGAEEYKWEKLNLEINYGDVSVVYKASAKNWREQYYFFARKEKTVYKYYGKSLDQIRGCVDALNSTQNSK